LADRSNFVFQFRSIFVVSTNQEPGKLEQPSDLIGWLFHFAGVSILLFL
jgi:hypothetical protein